MTTPTRWSKVFPATAQGQVEFFDGETSLGIAPVVDGVAAYRTRALPVGERGVTARHLGVLVAGSYGEIFGRTPSAADRSEGIVHLRATGDRSGLYAELIGRPEFATRAQGFPNRHT